MRSAAESSLGREQRLRLEASGEWQGEARISGRIHDRGDYPILVEPQARHETVFGELFQLRTPALAFRWLDLYEGIPPGKTRGAEYQRVLRSVGNAGGDTVNAWVYLHIGHTGRARRIADGRWRPREANPGMP